MSESYWYYGDLWIDQQALELLELVWGEIDQDEESDGGIYKELGINNWHVELPWDYRNQSYLEQWALACIHLGYFVRGLWIEHHMIDGPFMAEYRVDSTKKLAEERVFYYGQPDDTRWGPIKPDELAPEEWRGPWTTATDSSRPPTEVQGGSSSSTEESSSSPS